MDIPQAEFLPYLGVLGAALAGYLLVSGNHRLSQLAQHAVLWALVFLGVSAGMIWSEVRGPTLPRQSVFSEQFRVEAPRAADGHYYLRLEVNGAPVDFVVDTGATGIVLTSPDAERAGFDLSELAFSGRASTANGVVRAARAEIADLALGPIRDGGVPVWVNGGEMQNSLLGMAYLHRFERIEITDGVLTLER